jgi:hypothetical protein
MDRVIGIVAAIAFALVLLAMSGNELVLNAFEKIILSRLNVTDESSVTRLGGFYTSLWFFAREPLVCQLFGLGFGYVREANMFTTILVNLGIVGLLLTLFIFLRPIVALGWDERSLGIRASLIIILVTMMISVPEFSYLSIWLFLGIAYHEMGRRAGKERSESDDVGALRRAEATT